MRKIAIIPTTHNRICSLSDILRSAKEYGTLADWEVYVVAQGVAKDSGYLSDVVIPCVKFTVLRSPTRFGAMLSRVYGVAKSELGTDDIMLMLDDDIHFVSRTNYGGGVALIGSNKMVGTVAYYGCVSKAGCEAWFDGKVRDVAPVRYGTPPNTNNLTVYWWRADVSWLGHVEYVGVLEDKAPQYAHWTGRYVLQRYGIRARLRQLLDARFNISAYAQCRPIDFR